ncbi:MAG: hypothetical protein RJA70_3084 [Pseudomonadota bacterium]|jgi:uncharacterized membrane protein YdbT with pleckstrin-like domain
MTLTPQPAAIEDPEETLFEGRPALMPSVTTLLLVVLTLGVFLLYRYVCVLGLSYKVTSRRVVVETGVLSKKLEQVDLYRVSDYSVERPFLQRVMGTGNLVLQTLERTQSTLRLDNLRTDVVALYEKVRAATESDKRRRGVRLIDHE